MASVLVRSSNPDVEDHQISHEQASIFVGVRLDRRKSYALIGGVLCELVSWTDHCSGCNVAGEMCSARCVGCYECGYTGKRKRRMFVPIGGSDD